MITIPPKILETALYADDLDAAESFYTEVLGLEVIVRVEKRHVFFRLQDSVLLVFNPASTNQQSNHPLAAPPHGATGPGHACFSATNIEELNEWREKLENAGVEIETEITWPNGARSIYFRDPAGNSLEIGESKMWGIE